MPPHRTRCRGRSRLYYHGGLLRQVGEVRTAQKLYRAAPQTWRAEPVCCVLSDMVIEHRLEGDQKCLMVKQQPTGDEKPLVVAYTIIITQSVVLHPSVPFLAGCFGKGSGSKVESLWNDRER